jgi:CheY-like chemotaxis protein
VTELVKKEGRYVRKILIVDDEPDMLKLLSMVLREKTSYEVTTTNNPLEALDLAKKGGFDLVISDLKMPGLDGMEIIDAVKQVDEDIPIIIITLTAQLNPQPKLSRKAGLILSLNRSEKNRYFSRSIKL